MSNRYVAATHLRLGRLYRVLLVFWFPALAIGASILTPRNFDNDVGGGPAGVATSGALFAYRLSVALVLATSVALTWYAHSGFPSRASRGGTNVLGLAIGVFFLAKLTSYLLGAVATTPLIGLFVEAWFWLALVFFTHAINTERIIEYVRSGICIVLYASLLAAIFAPQWAVQHGYELSMLGISSRLHGAVAHANVLGPLAALYLVSYGTKIPLSSSAQFLKWLLAFSVLIATQSKTSLVGLVAGWIVCALSRVERRRFLRTLIVGMILASAGYMVLDIQDAVDWIVAEAPREMTTATGRLQIWLVTLSVWQDAPWFGYGQDLWKSEMQEEYVRLLGWYVPHAHNILIQALGAEGVFGFVATSGLFAAMVRAAWLVRGQCTQVSGMVAFVVIVNMFEVGFTGAMRFSATPLVLFVAINAWKESLSWGHRNTQIQA